MFEFLKDYDKFRAEIRTVKVETFAELKGLLDENEKLKRDLRDRDAKHEREIMTLSHSLQLERRFVAASCAPGGSRTGHDRELPREGFVYGGPDERAGRMVQHHCAEV